MSHAYRYIISVGGKSTITCMINGFPVYFPTEHIHLFTPFTVRYRAQLFTPETANAIIEFRSERNFSFFAIERCKEQIKNA